MIVKTGGGHAQATPAPPTLAASPVALLQSAQSSAVHYGQLWSDSAASVHANEAKHEPS